MLQLWCNTELNDIYNALDSALYKKRQLGSALEVICTVLGKL